MEDVKAKLEVKIKELRKFREELNNWFDADEEKIRVESKIDVLEDFYRELFGEDVLETTSDLN